MKSLLSLILVAVMSVTAVACPCVGNDEPCECHASCKCSGDESAFAGVVFTREQITSLPQDENKLYLTVIGNPNDARFKTIQSWFDSNTKLADLKRQTHFTILRTNDPLYRSRYASSTPTVPMVRLQAKNGAQLYEAAGDAIRLTSYAVCNSIITECFRRWRERCHTKLHLPKANGCSSHGN